MNYKKLILIWNERVTLNNLGFNVFHISSFKNIRNEYSTNINWAMLDTDAELSKSKMQHSSANKQSDLSFVSKHKLLSSRSRNGENHTILVKERSQGKLKTLRGHAYLSIARGLMGSTPEGVTRASIRTSFGVTGILPSSRIWGEYDNATAIGKEQQPLVIN